MAIITSGDASLLNAVIALGQSAVEFDTGAGGHFWPERVLANWLRSDSTSWLVAADRNGDLLGFLLCAVSGSGVATIENIVVEPGSRGLGLGLRLVAACEAMLTRRGVRVVRAYCSTASDSSLRLFCRAGFAVVADTVWLSFAPPCQSWRNGLDQPIHTRVRSFRGSEGELADRASVLGHTVDWSALAESDGFVAEATREDDAVIGRAIATWFPAALKATVEWVSLAETAGSQIADQLVAALWDGAGRAGIRSLTIHPRCGREQHVPSAALWVRGRKFVEVAKPLARAKTLA